MSSERFGQGYIKTPADAQPRPLTRVEAGQVFAALAARENEIAFGYLWEGCECRAQLMIERMVAMGIDPGRAWAVSDADNNKRGVQDAADTGRSANPRRGVDHISGQLGWRLEIDHPNFDGLMIDVESDLRRSRPVGVIVDPSGRILDLGAAHDTPVRSIQEFPNDPTRFQVGFWASSPVSALTREQPEFERLHATLTKAAKNAQMVWVIRHSQEVMEGEPDEDGLIATYPKIMDVRLA